MLSTVTDDMDGVDHFRVIFAGARRYIGRLLAAAAGCWGSLLVAMVYIAY